MTGLTVIIKGTMSSLSEGQQPINHIKTFFQSFPGTTLSAGDVILRPDDQVTRVFYLESGTVQQYTISDNGEVRVVNIFKVGSFFPMSNALNQQACKYFFETVNGATVRAAPVDEAISFLEETPLITLDLLRRVYSGVDGILEKMVRLMSGKAKDRIIVELLIHAERFGKKQDNGMVELQITEQQLGNQTGLARETVSRELAPHKLDGTIEVKRGKLRIDVEKLERFISN